MKKSHSVSPSPSSLQIGGLVFHRVDVLSAQIWRLPKVCAVVGLTRSGVYRARHQDHFPAPVRLGARAVGWNAEEVIAWLNARPRAAARQENRT